MVHIIDISTQLSPFLLVWWLIDCYSCPARYAGAMSYRVQSLFKVLNPPNPEFNMETADPIHPAMSIESQETGGKWRRWVAEIPSL